MTYRIGSLGWYFGTLVLKHTNVPMSQAIIMNKNKASELCPTTHLCRPTHKKQGTVLPTCCWPRVAQIQIIHAHKTFATPREITRQHHADSGKIPFVLKDAPFPSDVQFSDPHIEEIRAAVEHEPRPWTGQAEFLYPTIPRIKFAVLLFSHAVFEYGPEEAGERPD